MPLGFPIILKLGWQTLGVGVGYIVLSTPEPVFGVGGGVVLVGAELKESLAVDSVGEWDSERGGASDAAVDSDCTVVVGFSTKPVDSEELFFSLQALMVSIQAIPNKAMKSN